MREKTAPSELAAPEAALNESFEAFFVQEADRLLSSFVLITGSTYDAEDIAQDAFFRVWSHWPRVATMDNPAGYLYRTAMNGYRSGYRRAVLAMKRVVAPPSGVDPFEAAAAHDSVLRALSTLTPRQRAAAVLVELLGYEANEAAEVLDVQPGTVRTLVSRAKNHMRQVKESLDD